MSTNPFVGARFRGFDSNNNPLAGGKLYTYAAGTTTPLSTYTTKAGDVANANPVVLNANGEADVWLTQSVDYKFVLKDASDVVQWTVDNFPSTAGGSTSSGGISTSAVTTPPGGRLTLTSGTPVTTADVTGATTIYYAPYDGDMVPLFDGTNWAAYSIGAGLSQTTVDATKSPAAVANNSNYDLFVWNDSGIIRLSRGPAWTSNTARGAGAGTTELARQNGRYVNANSITNGPAAKCGLYVGTVHSDGSAHINDSEALRHVWNTYNRVVRQMRATDATNSWAYSTSAWRQANGSAANQVSMVLGLAEGSVNARALHAGYNSLGGLLYTSIGLDSTTAPATVAIYGGDFSDNEPRTLTASYVDIPGLGYHYLSWLEYSGAGSGTTWLGTSGQNKTGIQAEITC